MIGKYKKGAVSLFVVVFFSLLITVVTVGFIRITLKDTQHASTTDLSQSALDSAQAGVEDAKRALIRLGNLCGPLGDAAQCQSAKDAMKSQECNVALQGVASPIGGEVKVVQQQSGDTAEALDQAYTCVKITNLTDDYLGNLATDESRTIPLVGVSEFDRVKIEWFSANNISANLDNKVNLLSLSPSKPLIAKSDYPTNRPPVMKAHLVQVGNSFKPSDIESPSNTASMYLYPVSGAIVLDKSLAFNDGARKTKDKSPTPIECHASVNSATYACSIELTLPSVAKVDGYALLQLTSIYNSADFKVTMCNGSCSNINNIVKFNSVQPEIDSTGRANDLFRRVRVRVEGTSTYPYPDSAVETAGNLCKNFHVTDREDEYLNINNCKP